jgi:hypothetical protein
MGAASTLKTLLLSRMSTKDGSLVNVSDCIAHVEAIMQSRSELLPSCTSSQMTLIILGTMLAFTISFVMKLMSDVKQKGGSLSSLLIEGVVKDF